MGKKKVTCIIGTRPEVIKMAPVVRALGDTDDIEVELLASGQHREMLDPLLAWFGLSVDDHLSLMSENQSLSDLSARLIQAFGRRLTASSPHLVLAQGDTTTVMCAALCCFYMNIPFGHVEAGLRTFDVRNPFPEEFNRVAVTRLAQVHFCPTEIARTNVLAERVEPATVHYTGNTVIDALRFTVAKLDGLPVQNFDHDILVTAHRRENFGAPLANICTSLIELCREFPSLRIIYPVHPNPNVRNTVWRLLQGHPQIKLLEPLSYPELVAAMKQARIILTDSGGIQEEAPALGKPVLVLRSATERPEAVELGVAKIVGTAPSTIVSEARRLLVDSRHYERMARGGSPYGDGHAAERIRDAACRFLNARYSDGARKSLQLA